MKKKKNLLLIGVAIVGLLAVYLIWRSKKAGASTGNFIEDTISSIRDLPSVLGNVLASPLGGIYNFSKDPNNALRKDVQVSSQLARVTDHLRNATLYKGSELTAKEILPVTSGLSHEETKYSILASQPKTLDSYARVVMGTTSVMPQNKWSDGLTSFDRKIASIQSTSSAIARAKAEASVRGIASIAPSGSWTAV